MSFSDVVFDNEEILMTCIIEVTDPWGRFRITVGLFKDNIVVVVCQNKVFSQVVISRQQCSHLMIAVLSIFDYILYSHFRIG